MLLLLMATLVKVETSASSQQLIQLQARQNALLGVMIAIGELQKHAGPDQRVTARAELIDVLDANDPRKHWLGVWNTTAIEQSPRWLVSGNQVADGTLPLMDSTNAAQIIGEERLGMASAEGRVLAPKVLVGGNAASVNRMAYWVSDEGTKASLAPIFDSEKAINHSGISAVAYQRLLRQRTALAAGRPAFVPDLAHTRLEERGFSISRVSDLPFVWGENVADRSELAEQLKAGFHHYTGRAYGLLTDTVNGGFRRDLSSLERLSPELDDPRDAWVNNAVREGLNLWTEVQAGALKPRVVGGEGSADDPMLKLTPVISELFVGFAISGNAASPNADEIFIYYLIFAELWNPFTAPLEFSRRDIYDDIIVRVSGLPTVQLTNTTRGIERTVELPEVWMDLDFYDFIDGAQQDQFEPGRMTWAGNPQSTGGGSEIVEGVEHLRRNGVYIVSEPVGRIPGTTVEDFRGVFSATDIKMEFFLKGTAFEDSDDPHRLFWTLNLEGFEEFEREYRGGTQDPDHATRYDGSPSQFFRPRSTAAHGVNRTSINQARNSFNYWFRIDEELFLPGGDDFFEIIRSNALQRNESTIDLSGDRVGLNRVYDVFDLPEEMGRDITFSDLDFFSAKDSPHDTNPERWAHLIDLPRFRPTELAQLNFLVFGEDTFEKLGHRNSSDLNRLYDRYFLSGLPSDVTDQPTLGSLMPNPRFRVTGNSAFESFETWASDLLVVGAFNVNSTSPEAWAEIFAGSNLESWPVSNEPGAPREDLKAAWFSLPDFGLRMFNRVFSGTDNYRLPLRREESGFRDFANFVPSNIPQQTPVPPAFRQGFRELSDEERRQLGEEVTQRILERNRPFVSLREFWDSGVIQEAIDAVPGLNTDDEGNLIPYFSPGYFSQIQFASGAGSRLSARSDTFRIISYGEVENTATGGLVTARCEVLVQRLPKPFEANGTPSPDEREFVVLEISWLD